MHRPQWKAGFTLIELLVVIGIISILASLLFPTLSRAKDKTRAAACLNNLKQWGVATHLYTAENRDFLPRDGTPNPGVNYASQGWYMDLPPVIGLKRYIEMPWRTNADIDPGNVIWICPANPRRSNGNNLFHYCLNQYVSGTGDDSTDNDTNRPVKLGAIRRPGMVVWLFDSKNLPAVGFWNYVHTNLHNRGAQFLFLDGHAARFNRSAYRDLGTDDPITNNLELVWVP